MWFLTLNLNVGIKTTSQPPVECTFFWYFARGTFWLIFIPNNRAVVLKSHSIITVWYSVVFLSLFGLNRRPRATWVTIASFYVLAFCLLLLVHYDRALHYFCDTVKQYIWIRWHLLLKCVYVCGMSNRAFYAIEDRVMKHAPIQPKRLDAKT